MRSNFAFSVTFPFISRQLRVSDTIRGGSVESLPAEVVDDDDAPWSEDACDPVECEREISDVVERAARDHTVEGLGIVEILDSRAPEDRARGWFRIDGKDSVARG